jgi:hypothetical protein
VDRRDPRSEDRVADNSALRVEHALFGDLEDAACDCVGDSYGIGPGNVVQNALQRIGGDGWTI